MIRRVCVFCGSSRGSHPKYVRATEALADDLARREIDLVYGGGHVGLMGVIADRMLALGRHVIGVIPEALQRRELAHRGLPDLRVVASMHERKALMADQADAFIALPGGLGTIEELFEVLTWRQLGLHEKPIGLLDVDGYFEPVLAWVVRGVDEGFLNGDHAALLQASTSAVALVDALVAQARGPRPAAQSGAAPDPR